MPADRTRDPTRRLPPRASWPSGRTRPRDMPELMDAPDCDPHLLADALEVLDDAGRYMGGHRLLRRQALSLLRRREPGPVSILDIGAGGGDGARSLDTALGARGWSATFTLADLHAVTLSICRDRMTGGLEDRSRFVRLDGVALPFEDEAFDLAVSSLTLHHLEDAEARRLLGEMDRVARWGWAVTDLRRSRLAFAAVRILASTVWRRHAFPRTDGPISILRSFTADEVRALLCIEGLRGATVESRVMRWAARGVSRS